MEKNNSALRDVFIYYGADYILNMKDPIGHMDANGLVALLLELGITGSQKTKPSRGQKKALGMRASMAAALAKGSAAEDMQGARTYSGEYVYITKATIST